MSDTSQYDYARSDDYKKMQNFWKTSKDIQDEINRVSYGVDTSDYTNTKFKLKLTSSDVDAYKAAQADWMKGNASFDGWTDEDIASFQDYISSRDLTTNQKTAAQLYYNAAVEKRNANAEAKKDREDMLAEIEAYKAGFSNEHIAAAVAAERQAWDSKIAQTLDAAQQQAAAQGRVLDNSTYAMLRGRLEAQAATAIQNTQMEYEAKRQEYMYNAMSMKNDVYKNTTRTVDTSADLTSIISALAGK